MKTSLKGRIAAMVFFMKRAVLVWVMLAPVLVVAQQEVRLPDAKEKWIRVETRNFTLFSNAREKTAKEIGANLERLRAALTIFTGVNGVNSPAPTAIVLFKDNKHFEPYVFRVLGKAPSLGGYFLSRPDGNFIAMSAEQSAMQIIHHEYLHFIVNSNLPNVPPWFNEGIAEYYSTFESDDKAARIGLPVVHHITFLRSTALMPLKRLFATAQDEIFLKEEHRQGLFYAQSWLLVHYLMEAQEGRLRPQLAQFLKLLGQGQSQEQAFQTAFVFDSTQLHDQLAAYLRQRDFGYVQISSRDLKVDIDARVTGLSYDEVLVLLGDLLAHLGKEHLQEAEAYFDHAAALNANCARAYAGLGYVRIEQGRHAEARQHLEQAIQLDSSDARTHFHLGRCLMVSVRDRPRAEGAESNARAARNAFRAAIANDRYFAEAYAAFGETFVYDPAHPPFEGIKALEIALQRLPTRMDVALNLLTLYARNEESVRAQALLDSVITTRGNDALVATARQQLVTVEVEKAVRLLNEDSISVSLDILDRAQALTKSPQLLQEIAKIRRAADHKQHFNLYLVGVAQARQRNYDEALAKLEQAIASCEEQDLIESARHAIENVRHEQQVTWYNQAIDFLNRERFKEAAVLLERVVAATEDKELAKTAKAALEYVQGMLRQ